MADPNDTVTIEISSERLNGAIALLDRHLGNVVYPAVWRVLTAEAERRRLGGRLMPLVIRLGSLAELPVPIRAMLQPQ